MTRKIIKLIPKSNSLFHFGIKGLDETETIFHSDSLFSAIINNYAKINGMVSIDDKFIKTFPKISSVFHYVEIEKKNNEKYEFIDNIFFIPKPYAKLDVFDKFPEDDSKKIKKVEFISLGILKILNNIGGKLDANDMDKYILSKKYLVSQAELKLLGLDNIQSDDKRREQIYKKIKIAELVKEQKVRVNRDFSKDNEPFTEEHFQMCESEYYIEDTNKNKEYYKIKAGFYFLIEDLDESNEKLLQSIYLIKDEGLGGERSTGKGLFEDIKIDGFDDGLNEIEPNDDKFFVSLSLVFPDVTDKEYDNAKSFELIERKGFVYSPFSLVEYRKRIVRMFKEGSIFDKKVKGKIETVVKKDKDKFEHNVYRYGKAFLIPILYKGDDEDE